MQDQSVKGGERGGASHPTGGMTMMAGGGQDLDR